MLVLPRRQYGSLTRLLGMSILNFSIRHSYILILIGGDAVCLLAPLAFGLLLPVRVVSREGLVGILNPRSEVSKILSLILFVTRMGRVGESL